MVTNQQCFDLSKFGDKLCSVVIHLAVVYVQLDEVAELRYALDAFGRQAALAKISQFLPMLSIVNVDRRWMPHPVTLLQSTNDRSAY